MFAYQHLKISPERAEQTVFGLYGLSGKATPLPGEIDFNFRIDSDDGQRYILKISRPDEDGQHLDFQQKLLQHVAHHRGDLIVPQIVGDTKGNLLSTLTDSAGNPRSVRLMTWISGRIWSSVNPQSDDLRQSLGEQCGKLQRALDGFDHVMAHRKFDWDIAQSLWTKKYVQLLHGEEQELVSYFIALFEANQATYGNLRKGVTHNDANDNNIIVSENSISPKVITVIDYGDAVYTQHINNVAVTCAYALMGHNDPLDAALPIVKGYSSYFQLGAEELEHLYGAIAMRLVISVVKSAINRKKEPENTYLLISEKPAWEVLRKWRLVNTEFTYFSFRKAAGLAAHPYEEKFIVWAKNNPRKFAQLFPTIDKNDVHHLDLSVSSPWIGHEQEFNDLDRFQFKIDCLQAEHNDCLLAGGYLEPRPLYTSTEYDKIGNCGRESRTIHLGVDFWLPALTPVHALFDGEVVIAVNDAGDKEYGGLLVLKHRFEENYFYTLYGHLTIDSALNKKVGQHIEEGDCIGFLGNYPENGNWAPHLHFQVMFSLLGHTLDFPGVAYFKQTEIWKGICPDPNLFFNAKALDPKLDTANETLLSFRKKHMGKGLSLQYKVPIRMVRGAGQYLLDQYGQKYLDTVNNVAHVGHENYSVVRAGQEQMAVLNTNSRYLHRNINLLAEELLETLPEELSVLHFVNSGSEANELALRMVKTATGSHDIIASEVGYHGNTTGCIAISSYKFDGQGGQGAPEHTHIFPLPDAFRGIYRGQDTGPKYAMEVKRQIDAIHVKGRKVGAFIVEPIISCGGQIELPSNFLGKVYGMIREAGGLCISDEVQVGCGRLGKTFWGFQLYDVVPDIVTIGKPLGNGHPLAAVACTPKVAEKFANGMEYFNTFGGNPVSCAIGTAVLRTVKREKLQEHAFVVGEFLKSGIRKLALTYPIIGDVRGQGLFLGIELTNAQREPLGDQTDYLANRMKDHGILMSTDGPDHNVLKIKPPLLFTQENASELLFYLEKILAEDFMNVD